MSNIHWFPGHMKKALNEMSEKIKRVDVVIELLDMRIPLASVNEEFEKLTENKKKLFVYTKDDLADPNITAIWKQRFINEEKNFLIVNVTKDNIPQLISKKISELAVEKHAKDKAKGMKPQPVRTMIIGIPNVGKSSLINKIAKRKVAGVENKPGFTKGEQIIKVNNDFLLLDTPGVLPMSYEDKNKAIHLALTGAIKEEILPNEELASYLLTYLKKYYPSCLKNRFDIDEIIDFKSTIDAIAKKRGLLISGGEFDYERTYSLLLKEFKEGLIGRISLER